MGSIPRFCIHNPRKYKVVADGIYWCDACGEHYAEDYNPTIEEAKPEMTETVARISKPKPKFSVNNELIVEDEDGIPIRPVDERFEEPAGCPKACRDCLYRGGTAGKYCEMYSNNIWHCRRNDCIFGLKKEK